MAVGFLGSVYACGSKSSDNGFQTPGGDADGGAGGEGGIIPGSDGGLIGSDGGSSGDGGTIVGDPKDCNEAKTSKSYVGCDYYPTVTANGVWNIFDYAVVVSNTSTTPADITVTGGALTAASTVTVAPNELKTIYLPWVTALKGGDADNCGNPPAIPNSVMAAGGAYHLVSTSPVVVYQFNALEYKGAGGPTGKDWSGSKCPGNTTCTTPQGSSTVGCFSFSNDSSLLLPSTAMTGNYRVTGHQGIGSTTSGTNTFFTVTATQDNTTVTTTLSTKGANMASADGTTIPAKAGGGSLTFVLAHAGDVAEVFGGEGNAADFSGSLVQGDKPIQVISGVSALTIPANKAAADHTEETVLPVETLGKHYVVSMPDKPGGGIGLGTIRFYGNQDGTTLTYNGTTPKGCPTSINAGETKECTVGSVSTFGKVTSQDVEVTGSKELGVALFQQGSSVYGTLGTNSKGDPSESVIASVEQFRVKYLFLAPNDYTESYADIVGPSDAAPVVDGTAVASAPSTIGSGPYAVWRVKLGKGPKNDGAHTLTSTQPVGLQVLGYGDYTSYQYPGGLNLNLITAPPPPPR
ncbi:MAG: IgGFc-binding protein [Polyangiaceae bacterium]